MIAIVPYDFVYIKTQNVSKIKPSYTDVSQQGDEWNPTTHKP